MVNGQEVSRGVEWRLTVPEGSSVKLEPESGPIVRSWLGLLGLMQAMKSDIARSAKKIWKMGVDDPRKVIHCIKVGLALTLVSVFYYTRPLYDGVGGTAMWAVMTVVVIFEYTVGGSLYKGFNRAIATLSAGALALGIHWVASKSGATVEPIILGTSVFFLASAATFSRFIPTVKAQFDYGVTIFILTFSLVAVSGYRVDKLLSLTQQRMSTIVIGVSICLIICILVCPVWAGEDLHLLVARNMEKLADSLECCVDEYFQEDESVSSKKASCQKSEGYKCVLNSKASEDSLANLAGWEPAHGCFGFRHPWNQYLKVGAAMRYCAYCVEALNGCINSEIQAPEYIKTHLSDVCLRLSIESSKVLKELMESIKSMNKSSSIDFLVAEMNNAVEELHDALRTLPNKAIQPQTQPEVEETEKEKTHPISTQTSMPLMEALPLITIASLLVEISSRIEGVVEAVDEMATVACFKPAEDGKPEQTKPASIHPEPQGQEAMRGLPQV